MIRSSETMLNSVCDLLLKWKLQAKFKVHWAMNFSDIVLALVILNVAVVLAQNEWLPGVVSAFFASKRLYQIDAFLCNTDDGVKLMRHAYHADILGERQMSVGVSKTWRTQEVHDRRIGILFDITCIRNLLLLEESDKNWFNPIYSWLIWGPLDKALQLNLSLSLYSDVIVYNGDFHQATKFVSEKPLQTRLIGTGGGSDNLNVSFPEIIPNLERSVINGVLFAVQDIYNASNISAELLDMEFKHGYDAGNRFFYKLSLFVADLFNFTIVVKKSFDWGQRYKNGTWTGIINDIRQGDADISFTPLLPFSERLEFTHAVPSLQKYWFALIFKQPRALGTYKAMTLELNGVVWALVGTSVLAGAVVFTLTMKHRAYDDATLDLGLLQSIGIFTNQGLSILPERNSSRIACLTLLVVGLLVSNYYNAATMTALLSEAPPTIKTLEEFIASNLQIALLNASYNIRPFGRRNVFRPGLLQRVEKANRVVNVEGGLDAIRKGQAFCGEYYILFKGIDKNFDDDEKCSLTVFSSHVTYTAMRFIRQDKHLLEMFSRGLIKTHERGLVKKERDDWIAGPPSCFRTFPFIHVKLESVSVALGIFLGVGLTISAIVFVLELLYALKDREKVKLFGMK